MQRFISARTVGMLCAVLPLCPLHAQTFDPHLAGEVNLIRADVARNNLALRGYTWFENTQVIVKGKVQSSTDVAYRHDASGNVVKTPLGVNEEKPDANGVSKRPMVRAKADAQDYIDRAVSLIAAYIPPDPAQLDAMLARGDAAIEPSKPGTLQIRFKGYHQRGDSMIFGYDPVSKALLHVTVLSTIGPKDPVTMEAVFETLPEGVSHVASTTLTAKSKKIEIKTRNSSYTRNGQ